MALEFTGSTSNSGSGAGTYDHNLLINRGQRDQHTIESITGLREILNKKYEKPFSGIPKSDLAFDAATIYDLEIFKQIEIAGLNDDLAELAREVYHARGTEKTLKDYIDTKVSFEYWSGTGGVGGGTGSNQEIGYPLYETYRATAGQTLFALTKVYQMGTHQLEVFLDGLRMVEDSDYIEVDDHNVEFLFELEEGDEVLFMVRAVINSGLHEEFVATHEQTDFILKSPYGIHQNILQVYRNGSLQRKGRDYLEVTDRLVRFIKPQKNEDLITFHQEGATDPLAGTIMESELGRIKLNQAYTTMNVNEAVKITQTDYIDMFVDVFLSTNQIDPERSLTYLHKNGHIETDEVELLIDTTEEFQRGTFINTEAKTFKNQLRLKNGPGGAENNTFGKIETATRSTQYTSFVSLLTTTEYAFHFVVETKDSESTLHVIVKNQNMEIASGIVAKSSGTIHQLAAVSDHDGRVYLSYCEHKGTTGVIHYACFNTLGMIDERHTVSDPSYNAEQPTIGVDAFGVVHIAFASNRLKQTVKNIDYAIIKDGNVSGIQQLTTNETTYAIWPSLIVGEQNEVHLVYEEQLNIKYIKIVDRLISHTHVITNDAFENTLPQLAMDTLQRIHIVWCSKRMSTHRGFDYCTLTDSFVLSSRKSIMEGTNSLVLGKPRIAIDYENIAHIVAYGNAKQSGYTSILYSYVYPDGTVVPYEVIADMFENSLIDPRITILGDMVFVAMSGVDGLYTVTKSLANYDMTGQYTIVFDSRSSDTKWWSIYIDRVLSFQTNVSARYRLSEDSRAWSSWKDIDLLTQETMTGRYMQLQLTLQSNDIKETPKITGISVVCDPLWTEIYTLPKQSTKDISSVIVAARYTGDVEFFVARDGQHFVEATVEKAVNVTATPMGDTLVLKVRIKKDAQLHAWGMVW